MANKETSDFFGDLFGVPQDTAPPPGKTKVVTSPRKKGVITPMPYAEANSRSTAKMILGRGPGKNGARQILLKDKKGLRVWNILGPSGSPGTVGLSRSPDIDSMLAEDFLKGLKRDFEGTIQIHRSGPKEIYATLQDGETNNTFAIAQKDKDWVLEPRIMRKARKSGAARLLEEALVTKKAEMSPEMAAEVEGVIRKHVPHLPKGSDADGYYPAKGTRQEKYSVMDRILFPLGAAVNKHVPASIASAGAIGLGLGTVGALGVNAFSRARHAVKNMNEDEPEPYDKADDLPVLRAALLGGGVLAGASALGNLATWHARQKKASFGIQGPSLTSNMVISPRATAQMIMEDPSISWSQKAVLVNQLKEIRPPQSGITARDAAVAGAIGLATYMGMKGAGAKNLSGIGALTAGAAYLFGGR